MSVPPPPSPFAALDELVPEGALVYCVHSGRFPPAGFNPGIGAPTRFGFFGEPPVPVLSAGDTEDTALCESVLHDVPLRGGIISDGEFGGRQCSRLIVRRELRLASMVGLGPRALGITAEDVCATDAADYPATVGWAQAAHEAGFDGLAYPSKRAAGRRAMVFFGDRVDASDLLVDSSYGGWHFDDVDGFVRLYRICQSVGVTVLRLI